MPTHIDFFAAFTFTDALWLTARAALLVGAAVLAVAVLPWLAASYRYSILFYAIVATLLVPVFAAALPSWRVVPNWFAAAPAQSAAVERRQAVAPASAVAPGIAHAAPTAAAARGTHGASPPWSWSSLLALAWLAGVIVPAGRTGLAMRRLAKMHAQSVPLYDADWQALLDDSVRRLELEKTPALRFHPEPIMPITVGLREAAILLPIEAQEWPASRRRDVLLHELAHIKRGDLAGE